MDPDVTWIEIETYILTKDPYIDYISLCNDLEEWLKKGGVPPFITGTEDLDRVLALATCNYLTTAGVKV